MNKLFCNLKQWVTIKTVVIGGILILLASSSYISFHYATSSSVNTYLAKYPQNVSAYMDQNHQMNFSPNQEKALTRTFLHHYFSPWQGRLPLKLNSIPETPSSIKEELLDQFAQLRADPGMGANGQIYDKEWLKKIIENSDLKNFPRLNMDAISFRDTNIRVVPTMDPSYTNINKPGQGYPFDNLQSSFIPTGTPLHIVHVSKDGNWYLVATPSFYGWVAQQDVAFVSAAFKKAWQTGTYVVAVKDDVTATNKKVVQIITKMGVLYPVNKITKDSYQILTVEANNHIAVIKTAAISKKYMALFPLKISLKNIALVANNLLGKPYGWGGINGYRDCSSTQMDLMTTFGIWLPRNSGDQAQAGRFVSFAGLSNKSKERLIIKKGTPFFTLIHFPGHIALYVGEKNGHAYILHDMWGLHTYSLHGADGRVVVGKTVITPVRFGEGYINVSKSLLSGVDGMTTLTV